MPRALTEQEKCRQCEKLLVKGREVVLKQGIKKVSVDEITKAAGMAKGLFIIILKPRKNFFLLLSKISTGKFLQRQNK